MMQKKKPVITVAYNGTASIDPNSLFQEESEKAALHRLSAAVQKQINARKALNHRQPSWPLLNAHEPLAPATTGRILVRDPIQLLPVSKPGPGWFDDEVYVKFLNLRQPELDSHMPKASVL
jgi:hypothetical protein